MLKILFKHILHKDLKSVRKKQKTKTVMIKMFRRSTHERQYRNTRKSVSSDLSTVWISPVSRGSPCPNS